MNIEIKINVGKPVFQKQHRIYHHVHRIINEKLKKFDSFWALDEEVIRAPQKEFNNRPIEEIFYELYDDLAPKITKWKRKVDNIVGILFCIFYISLIFFFDNAYEETHGVTALIIFVIALAFLYIPWWLDHFEEFLTPYVEKCCPLKV